MNETLRVATLYDCTRAEDASEVHKYDHMWRQTVIGCRVLLLLQDMYKFNISYVLGATGGDLTERERRASVYPSYNDSIDIYVRPIAFRGVVLDNAYPIQAIFTWRYGFILRRPDSGLFHSLYSDPFTRPVWNCLYFMAAFITVMFYVLHRWERRVLRMNNGFECTFGYELLVTIAAYCQHSLPMQEASIASRRIACFTFFLFAYVIYAFYTSNLLSHLVSERDNDMDLEVLADSDYDCVVLENEKLAIEGEVAPYARHLMEKKFSKINAVNITAGLEALKNSRTALLLDFITIYEDIKKSFDNDVICQLIEIELYSGIKKYLFSSKYYPQKELLKIGTLRMKETGNLQRLISAPPGLHCDVTPHVDIQLVHIVNPLTILGSTYLAAVIVLIAERLCYKRFKVWPYVE